MSSSITLNSNNVSILKVLVVCLLTTIFCLLFATLSSHAQDSTTIVVRAKAKNAKFIGDEMGGAEVIILNAATGDTLAQGLTRGGTGNTRKLVTEPRQRYEKMSENGDAKFLASVMLKKPTLATIMVTANGHNPAGEIQASIQQWLIPGKDITGDGIVIEVPGFAVQNMKPAPQQTYPVGKAIPIQTHIVMMCGCSTAKGGLWDNTNYDIQARVSRKGKLIKTIPLTYSGKKSIYDANFTPAKTGQYKILVYVFNPKTANTGVAETPIRVTK